MHPTEPVRTGPSRDEVKYDDFSYFQQADFSVVNTEITGSISYVGWYKLTETADSEKV